MSQIDINSNVKLGGKYKLVITKPDGSTTETGFMDNLVLNQGLDLYGEYGISCNLFYCQVGTGNTPVNASQTTLTTYLANVGGGRNSYVNNGSPTWSNSTTNLYIFAQGAVVGNIAEIGVSTAPTAGLFSRALIVDDSGNPTTITLTSIDQLTVYYVITQVSTLTDVTGSVTLGGTSYPYTIRPYNVASNILFPYYITPYSVSISDGTATLQPITATGPNGIGCSGGVGTLTQGTYTPGTYSITWSHVMAPATALCGNGGIGAIYYNVFNPGYIQVVFSAPIPKTNTQTLTLNWSVSWSA